MKSPSESGFLTMDQNGLIGNGFWDIEDLSNYLKVKIKTLYAMTPNIPHYRVGKLIRFKKAEIDAWLESKRAKVRNVKTNHREKRKTSESTNTNIDRIIRKTIDQSKDEGYNSNHGKPDHVKGLTGKEVDHGSL